MPTTGGVADLGVELLGLTAVLRARPTGASKVVALYLSSVDPRVRADAANTLQDAPWGEKPPPKPHVPLPELLRAHPRRAKGQPAQMNC